MAVSFASKAMAATPLSRTCPIRIVSVHLLDAAGWLLRVLFLDRKGHISAEPHYVPREEALLLVTNQQRPRPPSQGAGALRCLPGGILAGSSSSGLWVASGSMCSTQPHVHRLEPLHPAALTLLAVQHYEPVTARQVELAVCAAYGVSLAHPEGPLEHLQAESRAAPAVARDPGRMRGLERSHPPTSAPRGGDAVVLK